MGILAELSRPEPGRLAKVFVIYCHPNNGKIGKLKVLPDPDDLEEIEPAYLARAPYSVWKGLLLGTIDPVEAVLKRRIEVWKPAAALGARPL